MQMFYIIFLAGHLGHHRDINRDIKTQNVPLFFNVFGGLQRF